MQIFRIVLNRSPVNFELIPVYDIHFGTVFHDKHLFNRLVRYIQDNENAYWFCGGDICYDEETEILTPEGWKKFTEIKERDTVICYWENSHCLKPSYIIKKFVFDYEGIAIKLESRYIDLLVTPEHRVLIKDASKSRIVKRAFELLGRKKPFWIPVAAPFYKRHTANGMQITHHVSEHTIKLLAWIITEGWLEYHHRNGKPFRIGIGQSIKHKEYVKEIEECITKLGLSARKYQRKDGVILWKFNTRSTEKLLSYFDSLDIHRIPRRLLNQDYPNLKILFDTLMKGDGIISKNTYCTTSEKLKDDFLELCCKLGYSCTVTKTSSNDIVINRKCKVKDIYRIYVRKRNGEGWAKVDNVSTQYYKGKVWCVTVPSGFIVVRRNGKIAICGNCEFINLQDKRFEYETLEKSFQKNIERILTYSVEYATEKLKPIANKCLFMISGNHDEMHRIRFGFDPISSICKNLGIKNYTNSYEALVKILFKHNRTSSLTLYTHHGHGYSKVRSGTLLNPLEDAMTNFDADIFIFGHSHYLVFTYKNFLTLNNSGTRLKVKQKLLLRVGGFRFSRKVGSCSYEEKRGMRPNATGTYIIKVIANPYPVGSLKFSVIPFI